MLNPVFSTSTPPQWIDLVERNPWLREEPETDPQGTSFTDEEIGTVFDDLKRIFKYRKDPPGKDQWGLGVWEDKVFGDGQVYVGDCDDFAFAAMENLKSIGVPIQNLHMVVCTDPENQGHMVAGVSLIGKTLLLDHQQNIVASPTHPIFKDYSWKKMNKGNDWFSIVLVEDIPEEEQEEDGPE